MVLAEYGDASMRITRRWARNDSDPLGIGPQLGFAAVTFSAFAAWSGLIVTIPSSLVTPMIATHFLAFAGFFAAVAWRRRREDPTRVTYADVAGALTLIGLFAASTIDPEQLAQFVQAERSAGRP
jgi:hypothetical protein